MLDRKWWAAAAVAVVVAVVAALVSFVVIRQDKEEPPDNTAERCYGCATSPDQDPRKLLQKLGITGYVDQWGVEPGDKVGVHVSTDQPTYTSEIVRVFHLDNNPKGPGIREQVMPSPVNAEYPGKQHDLPVGSYVTVPNSDALQLDKSFTISAWVAPTTIPGSDYNPLATAWSPAKAPRPQGIVSKWSGNSGYELLINGKGALALRLGDGTRTTEVSTNTALRPWVPAMADSAAYIPPGKPGSSGPAPQMTDTSWYFVAASYDAATGNVTLYQSPQNNIDDATRTTVLAKANTGPLAPTNAPLLMAAGAQNPDGTTTELFNGKIDNPRIYGHALSAKELGEVERGGGVAPTLAWDFTRDIRSDAVRDISSSDALTGHTVNIPERAVTGHNWRGSLNYLQDPDQFGGIHFHQDDLADAKWPTAFTYEVPADAESGIYAAKLKAGDKTYYVPFFVRPKNLEPTAKVAFVVPTFSYIAYGGTGPGTESTRGPSAQSLYSRHADGGGYRYSSRLRPMETGIGASYGPWREDTWPWQFIPDTHITDWLHAKGIKADILTDEDIHRHGAALLSRYRVVMTGTHPEYVTGPELDAFQDYTHKGGRVMYMGGNGFYWVTGMDPSGNFIEVRRRDGSEAWQGPPAESVLTTSAEEGGLWRFRGRAPQSIFGVGFTGQTLSTPVELRPYGRMPDSFDPRAAFVFDGVGKDEKIGDFPSLQSASSNGPAGEEIERVDHALGSPPNTMVLGRATGFSDDYQLAVEEVNTSSSMQGGSVNPRVYADMAYVPFTGGGAVFSTGSISYAGSLYYNNYDNNVSRITENVVRQFAKDEPLP